MKGFLIYPATTPKQNNAFGWFCEEALLHGIQPEVFFYDRPGITSKLEHRELPDFVLIRGYNTLLSVWYEARGVRVINSTASMKLCRDKYLSNIALLRHGLPVPNTFSEDSLSCKSLYDNAEGGYWEVCEKLNSSIFVMKMRFGSKGENVYLIKNIKQFEEAVAQSIVTKRQRLGMSERNSEFGIGEAEISLGCKLIFQNYISSSFGKDLRVWVFGGKVIGHVLRYNEHSFKSNFAQGGSHREIELSEEAAKIAVEAAKALGLDFAGVDLLFDGRGGFKICEVNGNPGFRTASVNIPKRIFEILLTDKFVKQSK